jgi:hypothetical protein
VARVRSDDAAAIGRELEQLIADAKTRFGSKADIVLRMLMDVVDGRALNVATVPADMQAWFTARLREWTMGARTFGRADASMRFLGSPVTRVVAPAKTDSSMGLLAFRASIA